MSGPRRLNDLIAGWQPGRTRASDRTEDVAIASFAGAWEHAVGVDVARRSRPMKFRNGVLTVLTASSAWSDELTLHAPAIVASLRRVVPDVILHRLRFTVASGRTQLVFERGQGSARSAMPRSTATASPTPSDETPPDMEALIGRLAATQATLDAQRDAQGWTKCTQCGKRVAPAAKTGALCSPCADAQRRRAQAALERVLILAPWSSFSEIRQALPDATQELFERTRSSLLTRWQSDIESASRRLRRGSLTPQDRVIAWSYVMLASGLAQRDLGRAAVDSTLGSQWGVALFGDVAPQRREAARSLRENHKH